MPGLTWILWNGNDKSTTTMSDKGGKVSSECQYQKVQLKYYSSEVYVQDEFRIKVVND